MPDPAPRNRRDDQRHPRLSARSLRYDDPRLSADIEREGLVAGLLGVRYDQCPYGRTHPDVRFSPWQRGRWKALGEWCDDHQQPIEWCNNPPEAFDEPA